MSRLGVAPFIIKRVFRFGVYYMQKLADPAAVARIRHAATEIETTAYDLAGNIEKNTVARLILIAADLEKIVESLEQTDGYDPEKSHPSSANS